MDSDGANPVNLTNYLLGSDISPIWSPDGAKIAFASDRQGNQELYVMNADGSSGLVKLTSAGGANVLGDWSPDVSRNPIVFQFTTDGNEEIYSVEANGAGRLRLTNNPAADSSPSWSPDGSQIVFTSTRDGSGLEIWVMSADGSNQKPITNNAVDDANPDWGP